MKATVRQGRAWGQQVDYSVEKGPLNPSSNCPSYVRLGPMRVRHFYRWNVNFPDDWKFLDKSFLNRAEALAYANRTVSKLRAGVSV